MYTYVIGKPVAYRPIQEDTRPKAASQEGTDSVNLHGFGHENALGVFLLLAGSKEKLSAKFS